MTNKGDKMTNTWNWEQGPIYTFEDRKPVRGRSLSPVNWEKLLKACEKVTAEKVTADKMRIPDEFWVGKDVWKVNIKHRKTDFEKEFEGLFEI